MFAGLGGAVDGVALVLPGPEPEPAAAGVGTRYGRGRNFAHRRRDAALAAL